jgi:hypothetical protein
MKSEAVVDTTVSAPATRKTRVPRREAQLRGFAQDAGLADDSKFLSHWFGVTTEGAQQEDTLPRPSPWNCFAREVTKPQRKQPQAVGYELRAWAHDAGLADDSQFLSHWFGVGQAQGQLPRPSPWNVFSRDSKVYADPAQVSDTAEGATEHLANCKAAYGLRSFAYGSGLSEDSQFLNHWFGMTNKHTHSFVATYGAPSRNVGWTYSY